MSDVAKLTIALVFDDHGDRLISTLAEKVTQGRNYQYRAGDNSIAHCTLVQAVFPLGGAANGEESVGRFQKIVMHLDDLLRGTDVASLTKDIVMYSKELKVTTDEEKTFVGIEVFRTTELQRTHTLCVQAMQGAGGTVVSRAGANYFPHVTLSYLQPDQQPRDITSELSGLKNCLLGVTPIIGINGDGGRLIEILGKVPVRTIETKTSKRRRFMMR